MSPRMSRHSIHAVVTLLLAVLILVPALFGFAAKFREFLALWNDQDGAFTIVPIVNYLLATAGFFLLLCWAIAHGMFRNIERPKHSMLKQEFELDEEERIHDLIGR